MNSKQDNQSMEGCLFADLDQCKDDKMDDDVAGGVIVAVSVITFLWYCFVLVNILRLTKKIPTFIIFFSQGIGDIGYLLNSLWLAVDIIIGPTSLVKNTKLYSITMNAFVRPVLYHFLFIAVVRLLVTWFPSTFKQYLTRRTLIIICCIVWLCVGAEVAVLHVIWPTEAYVNQNLPSYGFYSENLEVYLDSGYVIYLNAVNIFIGATTLLCYVVCLCACRKSSLRKSREGRLLAYCIVDCLIIFALYALKTVLYMQIRNSTKRVQLFVQVVYTCTYAISAILLPVFSADLWQTMFCIESPAPKNTNLRRLTATAKEGTITVQRMREVDNQNVSAMTLERS